MSANATEYTLNEKAPLGSAANPYPLDHKDEGPAYANKFFFRKGVDPTKKWKEEDLGKYTSKGKRMGREMGSTNNNGKNYVLPFNQKPEVKPFESGNETDIPKLTEIKLAHSAALGLAVFQAIAPGFTVTTPGTPESKVKRRRTGEEMRALLKEKGIKPNSAEAMDFILENSDVEDIVPAIPSGQVLLSSLVRPDKTLELTPGQVAEVAKGLENVVREAARFYTSKQ